MTYDIRDGGLVPSEQQPWLTSPGSWESPYGPVEGDEVFYRGGVDIFLFGHACVQGNREATRSEVSVAIGDFQRSITVFGDRVWEQGENGLVPSSPKPFSKMPLTLQHAFGGKSSWDGLDMPFPDNPVGKGFHLYERQAVGQPLPNIEDPHQLIQAWNDSPQPAALGFCPMGHSGRLQNNLQFDEHGALLKIESKLFNSAFPEMIANRVQPGEWVEIKGVSVSGPLRFRLTTHDFALRLTFGEEVIERPLAIDQIGIDCDREQVFITYRYPFRYVFYPLQRRNAELLVNAKAA